MAEKESLEAQVKDLTLRLANGDSAINELHASVADAERYPSLQFNTVTAIEHALNN